jgi:hypothetical protein
MVVGPKFAMAYEETTAPKVASEDTFLGFLGSGGGIKAATLMDERFFEDEVTMIALNQLECGGKAYARDRRKAMKGIVSEVYSLPG